MKRVLWLAASWRVRATTYIVLIIASIWVLIPFVWAVQNSINNLTDTFNPSAIIPFVNYQPTLTSWIKVLGDAGCLHALLSSIIVSFGTTVLVLLLGTPAAYSLARFNFAIGSKELNFWFFFSTCHAASGGSGAVFYPARSTETCRYLDRADPYLHDIQSDVRDCHHARRVS